TWLRATAVSTYRLSSSIRRSNSRSVQSGGIESSTCLKSPAKLTPEAYRGTGSRVTPSRRCLFRTAHLARAAGLKAKKAARRWAPPTRQPPLRIQPESFINVKRPLKQPVFQIPSRPFAQHRTIERSGVEVGPKRLHLGGLVAPVET